MKNYFRGPVFAGILFCMLAGFSIAPAHADAGHFNQKIRTVQMRLADLGYAVGYYDGIIGPKTEKAIKRFQRMHDLRANGRLTAKTCKLLLMTDYMAHHYYQTGYYSLSGYSGPYTGYPYNRPGHINPANGAWVVSRQDR